MAKSRARVLIVDDEPIKRTILEDELAGAGYTVTTAESPLAAEPALAESPFDVVVTDLRMPGQDGLSFLRDLRRERPDQAVIVMTAYGTVETAVEAMKLGAFDYIQKPFTTEELLLKLDRLLQYEDLARQNEALRRQLSRQSDETRMVGQSEALRQVQTRIHAVAGTDTTVLIEGESGTGKELVARMLHETSARSNGPFLAVSCAALPKELIEAELFGHEAGAFTGATKRRLGRFELAHGGTLFLDDADDIPIEIQVKLLRVLQNYTFERIGGEQAIRVNVRVIAATKKSLASLVATGRFREDLYYRLNVVPLYIPPLRDRREDIAMLVEHFLHRSAMKLNRGTLTIAASAMAKLEAYHWPGNVRELEHFVERMVALTQEEELTTEDIPPFPVPLDGQTPIMVPLSGVDRIDLGALLAQAEARVVRWALDRAKGNLAKAADMLSIPRSTLQYKVSKLEEGLDPD